MSPDSIDPAPEPEGAPPLPQGTPEPPPSAFRRIFFPLVFILCSADLLSALWMPFLPRPDEPDPGAEARSALGRAFELNLETKYLIGMRKLIELAPANETARETLLVTVEKGESKIETRLDALLRLVFYDYWGAEAGADRMRARLAPEASPPLPSSKGETEPLLERVYLKDEPISEADRKLISERLGFLGKLAAARSLRGNLPSPHLGGHLPRSELADEAQRFAIAAILGMIAAGGLLLVGLGLLIAFVIESRSGSSRWNFAPPLVPARLMFETFALYLLAMTLARELSHFLAWTGIAGSIIVQGLVPLVALYPLARGVSGGALAADLGLARPPSRLREIALGPVGYVGALPLMACGIFVTALLVQALGLDVSKGMHPIVPMLTGEGGSWLTRAAIVFAAVVAAPIVEELMFRGFFYRALRSRFGAAASVAASGFFFAAIHPQGWLGMPPLFAVGCALAILREWRGSLLAPMIAHACVNGVTLTMLFVMI